ncbi:MULTISPECIES: beta-glucosidase family protein [Sphingomonas]|uniref:beta-glucosidase family protein n=1 Tax=Sphingomonas TaxID=13687 RepID=UPI001962A51E|nr:MULTISPECIES: glycoside hydrolase family 3 N-terminal domain-containing protein [Sphingomonas]
MIKRFALALLATAAIGAAPPLARPWLSPAARAEQAAARTPDAQYAVATRRARQLVAAMTLDQKLQQLTGAEPELLAELPQCFGARHVSAIPALGIPTFRITNGPVGVGQNDCVAPSVRDRIAAGTESKFAVYTHPTSAKATALPSGMAVAASFDPTVATRFGEVIAAEMNALGLHVFEAPGVNLARLPVLGRNFEYFGEDPFLTGTMAVSEIKAVQAGGLIAMAKHYVANEQETNRMIIQETIDPATLREIYLLPFEMAVRDGHVAAVMCSYNFVNGAQACENKAMLTDVLRGDWGFRGYVQTDFFAMKSTVAPLRNGLDHEMPTPIHWAPDKVRAALAAGEVSEVEIDRALTRRFTEMFRAGIFDRPVRQTPLDVAAGGRIAREIGVRSAVLLQNNGALPLAPTAHRLVLVGKASQPFAQQAIAGGAVLGKPMGGGGGSSDVVPHYTVAPAEGIRAAMPAGAALSVVLVDDDNRTATIDGGPVRFADALAAAAAADAVIVMAGTVAEEGADRATFHDDSGHALAAPAAAGQSLNWYSARPNSIATVPGAPVTGRGGPNVARSSGTEAMLRALLAARSTTGRTMAQKTALVLKDNAGVALDPAMVGPQGPAILEAWFPGQEDGRIVADLLFGRAVPGGKTPVTFPFAGRSFLDTVTATQFPGVLDAAAKKQTVTYAEGRLIGYRWYDANARGRCAAVGGRNPCVAFPFGYGLSYTSFTLARPSLVTERARLTVRATVRNSGARAGSEVVQAYVALPGSGAKRLVGFARVDLAPGASRTVSIPIALDGSNHPLQSWDAAAGKWFTPAGSYRLLVGTSSQPRDLMTAGTYRR